MWRRISRIFGVAALLLAAAPGHAQPPDWPNVGNDKGGMRHSPLRQIHRDNVANLTLAWAYHAGDADPAKKTTIECTPLVVDGVLYLTTVHTKIVALNAATGREIWKFDPYADPSRAERARGVNRGVAFWSNNKPGGPRRILAGTADGRLISLDARTGKPDPAFGKNGEVDLRAGIEEDISNHWYGCSSPPAVFENIAILGLMTDERQPSAPGDVRAFDVRTGREIWRFHTVPRPYEFGSDTWEGDSWKRRGGANPWSGFTLDTRRGIVFCGTGSATSDYYGGDRRGDNLFANCTLALDARTGRRLWHFQTVRHDLWDYDNPCPPVVVTVRHRGRRREAVAQVTKTGHCFLLDRRTGAPLFGVEERPAPASDVPGEQAAATQVFPRKPPPFARQRFTEEDATELSPAARDYVLQRLRAYRHGPIFTPPSLRGTVGMPGFLGGANWSGASFDPATGLLYVNSNDAPRLLPLTRQGDGYDFPRGYLFFQDQEGYPAIKPPWGSLTAIDLNTGEFAWRVVLGEFPELTARGLPPTGAPSLGGTIVTAGGLVFVAGTTDEMFRAFDKRTGAPLWEYKLDAGGYATPCTYAVNGRQFVVIAAGGGGRLGTKSGDVFLAFALPETGRAALPALPLRIDSGGPGDAYSSGGATWTYDNRDIAGTDDDALYLSTRYSATSFRYRLPAADGSYTLKLHFADGTYDAPGRRVFHVNVNGRRALTNFDIAAQAGGINRAVIKSLPVTARGGEIVVAFEAVRDNAGVCALELEPRR